LNIDELQKEVKESRAECSALKKDAKVNVARAAASSGLGQGKEGANSSQWGARKGQEAGGQEGHKAKCLVPGCSEPIQAPKRINNAPTVRQTCWNAFHESGDEERRLKDNRTVTKTHNPKCPRSASIKKLMVRCQTVPEGWLEDQAHDFCAMVNISNGAKANANGGA
jgi:hypothetical protein